MVLNLSAINMYMVKSANMCTYARHRLYYRLWKVLNNQDLKKVIKELGNSSKKGTYMIFSIAIFSTDLIFCFSSQQYSCNYNL